MGGVGDHDVLFAARSTIVGHHIPYGRWRQPVTSSRGAQCLDPLRLFERRPTSQPDGPTNQLALTRRLDDEARLSRQAFVSIEGHRMPSIPRSRRKRSVGSGAHAREVRTERLSISHPHIERIDIRAVRSTPSGDRHLGLIVPIPRGLEDHRSAVLRMDVRIPRLLDRVLTVVRNELQRIEPTVPTVSVKHPVLFGIEILCEGQCFGEHLIRMRLSGWVEDQAIFIALYDRRSVVDPPPINGAPGGQNHLPTIHHVDLGRYSGSAGNGLGPSRHRCDTGRFLSVDDMSGALHAAVRDRDYGDLLRAIQRHPVLVFVEPAPRRHILFRPRHRGSPEAALGTDQINEVVSGMDGSARTLPGDGVPVNFQSRADGMDLDGFARRNGVDTAALVAVPIEGQGPVQVMHGEGKIEGQALQIFDVIGADDDRVGTERGRVSFDRSEACAAVALDHHCPIARCLHRDLSAVGLIGADIPD